MIRAEQDRWGSIAQLAAEYETIAAVAQRDRWVDLFDRSGLTRDQVDQIVASDSFGPLTAELRRVEASHADVARVLPRVVGRLGFGDAIDIGAVLISRLQHESRRSGRGKRSAQPRLIAGLIPAATGAMDEGLAEALRERVQLIEWEASELAEQAVEDGDAWVKKLGPVPEAPGERTRWLDAVGAVAAYRARYNINSRTILGDEPATVAQRHDASRAEQAVRRATAIRRGAADDRRLSRSTTRGWDGVVHRPGK